MNNTSLQKESEASSNIENEESSARKENPQAIASKKGKPGKQTDRNSDPVPVSELVLNETLKAAHKDLQKSLEQKMGETMAAKLNGFLKTIEARISKVAMASELKLTKDNLSENTKKQDALATNIATLDRKLHVLEGRLSALAEKIDGIGNASGEEELGTDSDTAKMANAAIALASMSKELKNLYDEVCRFSDTGTELRKAIGSAPEKLSDISSSLSDSSKSLTEFLADLNNPTGKIVTFSNTVQTMSGTISKSISRVDSAVQTTEQHLRSEREQLERSASASVERIEQVFREGVKNLRDRQDSLEKTTESSVETIQSTIRSAETCLQSKQAELEQLAVELRDAIDVPHVIREEVVPKLETFFGSVSESVNGLSERLSDLKERMASVGDLAEFRKKAELALQFGEACKQLQASFDAACKNIEKTSSN